MNDTLAPTAAADAAEWSLEWRGATFHERDLTGRHLAAYALVTGNDNFADLDIDPRNGHQRLTMMLITFLIEKATDGMDIEDIDAITEATAAAIQEVQSAPADEILGSLRYA